MKTFSLCALLAFSALTPAAHAIDELTRDAAIGGAIGGGLGGAVGAELGGRSGAIVGAGVGGAAGAAIATDGDDTYRHHDDDDYRDVHRHHRYDDDYREVRHHHRYDDDHHGKGYFCPPGQAKKGRC
ncbi:MAG: hypothetical protein IT496_06965 [Gammaproteobacteria bacterium]|nr:hypothetical protein [Gammaproteobacteria bacterium]MCG3142717.1 hypothetical protein [Gammaproteobacteria bacterium]